MSRYGSIEVSPSGVLEAGSRHTFVFTYTVGAAGLKAGGSLRIATPNDDWAMPLAPMHRYVERGHERGGYDNGMCSYARRNLAVSLESVSPDAWIDLEAQECMVTRRLAGGTPWARHIVAAVRDGDLQEGDRITLTYGDTDWGEPPVQVQRVAPTLKDRFMAFVDVEGTRDFETVREGNLDSVTVLPGPPSRINVVLPAMVRPGERFRARIAVTDSYRNLATGAFQGALRLGTSRASVQLPGQVMLDETHRNVLTVENLRARSEGLLRVTAEPSDGSGARARSNPVWVTDQDLNLYFGDLHCQSMYHSDSLGTPAEGYTYGRDIGALDFMAITDSGGCRKEGWIETQQAARDAYVPGRFVTFKGFEYGAMKGHRNVIYRDCEDEPLLDELSANDPEALFAYFRGRDVIIIPHHTKVWTDWGYHDPELEPIAEVYSCWGSGVEKDDPLWHKSTRPGAGMHNALARGYRLGFIGSGDSHSGMPGRSFAADRQWCVSARSGLACVYAPDLTREAVFDALRQRRCFATTGERMILEFRVNDRVMGSEVPLQRLDEPRRIAVHVIGTDELDSLKLILNGETLVERSLNGQEEAFFDYVHPGPAQDGDYLFVRITQKDGNAAWSSPVWLRCVGSKGADA